VGPDALGQVLEGHPDVFHAVTAQKLYGIGHDGLVAYGHHGLGTVAGKGLEPCAASPCHDQSFQWALLLVVILATIVCPVPCPVFRRRAGPLNRHHPFFALYRYVYT